MTLKTKVLEGTFWVSTVSVINQMLTFVSSIALARLLVPDDFGAVAIAMLVINGLKILYDLGLAQALIYHKDEQNNMAPTVFFLIVLTASALYLVVVFATPAIAHFYRMGILGQILPIMALAMPISALGRVPGIMLEKKLGFRKLALPETASFLCYATVSVALAYLGYGVWSIVWGRVLQSTVSTILLFRGSKWRPKMVFVIPEAARALKYGKDLLATSIMVFFFNYYDNAVIGKAVGQYDLGLYSAAYNLASLPATFLMVQLNRVLFPSLTQLRHTNEPAMRNLYLEATRFAALLALPSALGLYVLAPNIVIGLYTEKWAGAIDLLKILSIFGLMRCLGSLPGSLFQATGKQSIMPKVMAAQSIPVLIVLYPIALRTGAAGVAWTMTIAIFMSVMFSTYKAMAIIEVSVQDLVRRLIAPVGASLAMSGVLAGLAPRMAHNMGNLMLLLVVGVIVYGTCLLLLTRGKIVGEIKSMLLPLLQSFRRA